MRPVSLLLIGLLACDDPAAETAPDAPAADASSDATPADAEDAPTEEWTCRIEPDAEGPEFLRQLGCETDFQALASTPLDASVPGARSLKTVVDRVDGDALYFQNTHLYGIHHEFVSAHLSGRGLPVVPMLSEFNATEYASPTRRFLLGAVTFYEGPGIYAYEIAPYDAADADMVATAVARIAAETWIGDEIYFHPTSDNVARIVPHLPESVRVITTEALYEGIDYQPLNIAEAYGRLVFVPEAAVEDTWLSFRDIPVLEAVPNDISVVAGIITAGFQTPLSHINVLSRNRGTPNMALRGAFEDETLRALEGAWVRLEVGLLDYTVERVDQAEADAWWEANKPDAVQVPGVDRGSVELVDCERMLDPELPLYDAIKAATRAYGGKGAHFAALTGIEGLPVPRGFGVPVRYYFEFMEQHGFDERVRGLLADPDFTGDPATRDAALEQLRDDIERAPLDEAFQAALQAKLEADYPGTRMRFRSSTNAEDLDGFTGAGLYTSKSGEVGDRSDPPEEAVREVWASVWNFRAFEERSYRSIDHLAVGMALLVHRSFPDEHANGVALTNNPFDRTGAEPAFFVNAQAGEISVVQPDPGILPDSFLYFWDRPDQPVTFLARSTEVPEGETVLTPEQTRALGEALAKIRAWFAPAYGGPEWWAMDVEFKIDGDPPALVVKQARPFR